MKRLDTHLDLDRAYEGRLDPAVIQPVTAIMVRYGAKPAEAMRIVSLDVV